MGREKSTGWPLPFGHLVHTTPERLRIKIPSKKRDFGYFTLLQERLPALHGIENVEVNAVTGSVLISYTGSVRSLARFVRSNDLFELRRPPRVRTPLFGNVAGAFADYNKRLMQITGGQIDLHSLAFISLLGSGVYQIVRGNITAPAWYTAFYYALGVFSHRKIDEIDDGEEGVDDWDSDSESFSELDLSE